MASPARQLLDRLAALDAWEKQENSPPPISQNGHHTASSPPAEVPTLQSAIATHEKIVARLEEAIADTRPSSLGSLGYQRLTQTYASASKALADLRDRLSEDTGPTQSDTTEGARYLVARAMTQSILNALHGLRDDGAIDRDLMNVVWRRLVVEGAFEFTKMTPAEIIAQHHQDGLGQAEIDADMAAHDNGDLDWFERDEPEPGDTHAEAA